MAKAAAKKRAARKPGRKKMQPANREKSGARAADDARAEADAYTRSLIAHGQAVKLRPGEPLPAGATHELVEDDDGRVRAVRRRFSAL